MGLDVYLYRRDKPLDEIEATQDAYNEFAERAWNSVCGKKKYEDLTEDDKEQARSLVDEWEAEHGLGEYGKDPSYVMVELPSKLYPEHLFRIGYFRSSYNQSGINSVLEMWLGYDGGLQGIFESDGETTEAPDWEASAKRARQLIEALKAFALTPDAQFTSVDVAAGTFRDDGPQTYREMVSHVLRHDADSSFDSCVAFSDAYGTYFLGDNKELVLVAAMALGETYGRHRVRLFFRTEHNQVESYIQSLEVVVETCEWVLEQENTERYVLAWSG